MTRTAPVKKILIAGASGCIGKALIPKLIQKFPEAEIIALSRSKQDSTFKQITWIICDLFSLKSLEQAIPKDLDLAFYLVHSMGPTAHLDQGSFADYDLILADNFARAIVTTEIRQLIYLGGLVPENCELSLHLESRREVETVFIRFNLPVTIFRAGLILGESSSSFQILLKLVSQLPVMICPYWTQTLTSPVDLATVLDSLTDSALKLEYTRKVFDLAGCQALTYLEMMRETARKIGKHRLFIKIPLFTPTLSRLWVRLITGSSKNLIYPLVESLKHEMVARKEHLYPNMNIDRSYYDLLDSVTLRTNKTRKALAYKLHCKTVRSVQRFPLPRGKDASWTTDKYINWLPWLLAPFIKINIDLEKVEFSLLFKKWVLIGFLKSPQRSDPTRQLLYITNGLLVHQKNRGRLEFREVLDRKYIIAAVHDYRPSLPWFIYLFVQAKIHLWVMSSFSSYVGKYEKTHKNITNENSRAMTLKSTIGSGALVIQDNSVLLVQLNYGHLKGQWILPGGLLEPGENPEQAAKRELKEETNQVGEIVVLHSVRFRKDPADVYWVFRIRLESQRPIEFPREELQCVRFWSIEEALSSKEVRPMTKYFVSSALSSQPSDIELPKQHADTDLVYFFV